jgi:hypothetical protein
MGWPGYTPRHLVPFSSPPTIHSATVEVFDPTYTGDSTTLTGSPKLSSRKLLGMCHIENTPGSIVVVRLLQLLSNGFYNPVFNSNSIVVYACLPRRFITAAVVSLLVSRSLPSNRSICHNIYTSVGVCKTEIMCFAGLYVSV